MTGGTTGPAPDPGHCAGLYRPDNNVTVYYRQSSPDVSVLEPGPGTWYYYLNTLLGLIGTLVTGGIVLYSIYYTFALLFIRE